jgi:ABC-type oligopeptide transport system ATPase subunit
VCDEPVSALDVSIQSQVLNLLDDLQQELGLTYLLIAQNLAVVEHISDRVGVMYLGALAEIVDVDEIYAHPAPRTRWRSSRRCRIQARGIARSGSS